MDEFLERCLQRFRDLLEPFGVEVKARITWRSPLPLDWSADFRFTLKCHTVMGVMRHEMGQSFSPWTFREGFEERIPHMAAHLLIDIIWQIDRQKHPVAKESQKTPTSRHPTANSEPKPPAATGPDQPAADEPEMVRRA